MGMGYLLMFARAVDLSSLPAADTKVSMRV
jgi:hypothetical protein